MKDGGLRAAGVLSFNDGGRKMKISNPALAAAVAAVALAPTWVWAQAPSDAERYGYGPHMMWWGGGWAGMIFGPLFMILVFAVVIALVLLFTRSIGGPWHGAPPYQGPPARTPLDILKERFARGEIDKQEFEERRRVLGD
jgi:putative membrane protein